jgi:butyryl-CoA dehydrogenase
VEVFLADATLYLEFFGTTTIAWQWLKQATQATKALEENTEKGERDPHFYQGKIATARYYFEYELVKTSALAKRLMSPDRTTIEMKAEWF